MSRHVDQSVVDLATRLRAARTPSDLEAVAADVVCDGPSALGLALVLDREELGRLLDAVDHHLDNGRTASVRASTPGLVVGGEARGGPVLIPFRGRVS